MPEEPISLSPYSSAWPAMFEAERALLQRALAPWLAGPIMHIGSTAIPGMIAKPVIDIMVAVYSLQASTNAKVAAGQLGYVHFPYRPDQMHWFCKPSPERRTHHLHLVPVESALFTDRIVFRDYLTQTPEAAAEYQTLKIQLAKQHMNDREAYTDGKTAFVEKILRRARADAMKLYGPSV